MFQPPQPQVLQDIRLPKGLGTFTPRSRLINLSPKRSIVVPIFRSLRYLVASFIFVVLIAGSVSAPTTSLLAASTGPVSQDERKALESQLEDLEKQIDQYENQVLSYQKQGSNLKGQIGTLNSKISKINLQIKAINLTLLQLDKKIGETEVQIDQTEGKIDRNKRTIGELIRTLHQKDKASLIEIFLENPRLSDFFGDLNNINLLQGSLRSALNESVTLHAKLSDEKTQLSLSRADAATIKVFQAQQKQEAEKVKTEKNDLLVATKGEESRFQTLVQETKKTASQIRSRLFELLGGGELTFEQAYQYAKLASQATGVRAALILAVLDRESSLGQNVGRCSYKTAMSPKNQPIFLELTAALGINPEVVTVSCPNKDGVYGGAMGPAQFIPSTWNLYHSAVSKVTGHAPASPWNNADAFVATALYLRDSGAVNASIADERKAAARYYAGGRWANYLWTYGEAVISRANRFEQDIQTIGV